MKKCPRCKKMKLEDEQQLNALSRRASVYICNTCGDDEAMIDLGSMEPDKVEKEFVKTHKRK